MKSNILIVVLITICSQCCVGQEKGFPLRILVGNQATSLPLESIWSAPFHITIQVGSEFKYHKRPKHDLYQTINVGYMFHKHLFQGGYLNTELGYDYHLPLGIKLKALLGLGYLHTFSTDEEYSLENGQYERRSDRGNARLMPSLAGGIGFRLNKEPNSSELILLYRTWVEYPYSPGFIPLLPHTDISLGLKLYIN